MFSSLCQTSGTLFAISVAQCLHREMESTLVEFLACLWICCFGLEQRTQGRAVQHCCNWAVDLSWQFDIIYRGKKKIHM